MSRNIRSETYKALYKEYERKAKGKQRERVNDLLNLYKDGRIFSKITLQRDSNRYLGQSFKNETERELYYFKTMVKHFKTEPLAEKRKNKRINADAEKVDIIFNKVERKAKARYTIKAILYSRSPHGNQKKWKHDNIIR